MSNALYNAGPLFLFRRACHGCGVAGSPVCDRCRSKLTPAPSTSVRGIGQVGALFAYEGVGATLIQSFKFRDGRLLASAFADHLATEIAEAMDLPSAISWLPTSARRRRERGFDQAEILARAVGRRLGVPVRSLLRRTSTAAQTGLSWEERSHNVAFRARRRACGRCRGAVALIDDVCTTGATVRAAAAALENWVDGPISFYFVARTP